MRNRILTLVALAVVLVSGAVWIGSERNDPQEPLHPGVPIAALAESLVGPYTITAIETAHPSPPDAPRKSATIKIGDAILIQETLGTDYLIYTLITADATDLTLAEDFSPHYDAIHLENGAILYRRSGNPVMPTTEYSYVEDGEIQTGHSVCDFVVCPGDGRISWALSHQPLTEEKARLIAADLRR